MYLNGTCVYKMCSKVCCLVGLWPQFSNLTCFFSISRPQKPLVGVTVSAHFPLQGGAGFFLDPRGVPGEALFMGGKIEKKIIRRLWRQKKYGKFWAPSAPGWDAGFFKKPKNAHKMRENAEKCGAHSPPLRQMSIHRNQSINRSSF